jgi:hypothetical protein
MIWSDRMLIQQEIPEESISTGSFSWMEEPIACMISKTVALEIHMQEPRYKEKRGKARIIRSI